MWRARIKTKRAKIIIGIVSILYMAEGGISLWLYLC